MTLNEAVQIRKEPQRFTKEDKSIDNTVIQRFADVLEGELNANSKPYYLAYEKRYQAVYASGATIWGHQPDDEVLVAALTKWVAENDLKGKNIIEYACGEGSVGIILSKLGCIYRGVDIAPSAVERSKQVLAEYSTATVSVMDMVNELVDGVFDAAIDCMGFHMLVTDRDRMKYLTNVYAALKPGAPMLFFRQVYHADAYSGAVATYEDWKAISGVDYETPSIRQVTNNGKEYQVNIPLVPARGKNKAGYIAEMTAAGFAVDRFVEMEPSRATLNAASIYVHKAGALIPEKSPQSWPDCDEAIRKYINGLMDLLKLELGENLVGIYLHGSLAMGSYYPPKSDIDLLIVTYQSLKIDIAKKLNLSIAGYAEKRLSVSRMELSVITLETAQTVLPPIPYELHYSEMWHQRICDNQVEYGKHSIDADLPAHLLCVKKRGVCLYGKPVDEVFGEVKWQDYILAVLYDFDWIVADENICESPYYCILNICRVLQSLKENNQKILSKYEGGIWGVENLSSEFQPLIQKALAVYSSDAPIKEDERKTGGVSWDKSALLVFRDFAMHEREVQT